MIIMKLKYLKPFFCVLFFFSSVVITPVAYDLDEEDSTFSFSDDGLVDNFAAADSCNKFDIIDRLIEFNVINILREGSLYLKTNYLNKRSILDDPLMMNEWSHARCNYFSGDLFFNEFYKQNFTTKQDTINAYLAVGNDSLIAALQDAFESIEIISPLINPERLISVISLLENFIVQERQLGYMLSGQYCTDCWRLRVKVPLLWHEKNYFLSLVIQQALQELLDPITGAPSPTEQVCFQKKHLISDQFGVGDTRLEADYLIIDKPMINLRAGMLMTIPTAFPFKKGLYGSVFSRNPCRPTLDLCSLDTLQEQGICVGSQALDTLAAILLDTRLGNNGHLGLGALMHTQTCLGSFIQRPWAQHIKIKSRLSAEYLLPKYERLFFIKAVDSAEFDCRDFKSEEQVDENFDFITQAFTDLLFPFNYRACVFPGLIWRSTTRLMCEGERWGGYLGFDSYLQLFQNISSVKAPTALKNQLLVCKAQKPWIYQSKVIGGLCYKVPQQCAKREVTLSLNGAITGMSRGIGKDFTLTFNCDINF